MSIRQSATSARVKLQECGYDAIFRFIESTNIPKTLVVYQSVEVTSMRPVAEIEVAGGTVDTKQIDYLVAEAKALGLKRIKKTIPAVDKTEKKINTALKYRCDGKI